MKNQDKTKVTRISASDKKPASQKKTSPVTAKKSKAAKNEAKRERTPNRFVAYFKGAWYELRQVHWPTRRATWGLTGAVLLFSAFFVVFITLLDAGFKYVFEQILR